MPLLVDVLSLKVLPSSSQHFGVAMNINYMVIFINFLLQNFDIVFTKDVLIIGIYYLSRIWHICLECLVLIDRQLCNCLTL